MNYASRAEMATSANATVTATIHGRFVVSLSPGHVALGDMARHYDDVQIMYEKASFKVDEADMGRRFVNILRGTICILHYLMVYV